MNDVTTDISAPDYQRLLTKLGACTEARHAAEGKSLREAWTACERGDWLLWLAARIEIDRKLIVRAACDCARTALKCVKEGDTRPLKAIETAEAWCEGKATIEEVRAAAAAYAAAAADAAAYAAAAYAAAAAAADAAAAAAYAAYAAAAAAAYAAAYAADAADAAAADAADAYAARRSEVRAAALKQLADSVRERIAFDVVAEAAVKTLG